MRFKSGNTIIQLLLGCLLTSNSFGQSFTIDFEDAFTTLGFQGDPTNFFISDGLTISGTYFGLLEGVSRGDSGNFDLEGTSGPASLAANNVGHSIELNFNRVLNTLCIDIGSAHFAQQPGSPTVTISGFANGQLEHTENFTVVDTLLNGEGTWYSKSFANLDRLTIESTSGTLIWAIDNIVVDQACEPSDDDLIIVIPLPNGGAVNIVL